MAGPQIPAALFALEGAAGRAVVLGREQGPSVVAVAAANDEDRVRREGEADLSRLRGGRHDSYRRSHAGLLDTQGFRKARVGVTSTGSGRFVPERPDER